MTTFKRAVRTQRKFHAALVGPSGSGKTWTALEMATGLAGDKPIALLDTERSSASLYSHKFAFDCCDLTDTSVRAYVDAIDAAVKGGYGVLIIDSLSHAWDAILELHDNETKRSRSKNSFEAWKEVTPIYKQLVAAIVNAPIHIICTMRAKTDYVMEEFTTSDGKTKTRPVKVGLAPIFRAGGEYEFDVVANIDLEHNLIVEKTRLDFLADRVIKKADSKLGIEIREWLSLGEPAPTLQAPAYRLQSQKSKMCGLTLPEIWEKSSSYLSKAMSPEYIDSLTEADKENIAAFLLSKGLAVPTTQPQA